MPISLQVMYHAKIYFCSCAIQTRCPVIPFLLASANGNYDKIVCNTSGIVTFVLRTIKKLEAES